MILWNGKNGIFFYFWTEKSSRELTARWRFKKYMIHLNLTIRWNWVTNVHNGNNSVRNWSIWKTIFWRLNSLDWYHNQWGLDSVDSIRFNRKLKCLFWNNFFVNWVLLSRAEFHVIPCKFHILSSAHKVLEWNRKKRIECMICDLFCVPWNVPFYVQLNVGWSARQ